MGNAEDVDAIEHNVDDTLISRLQAENEQLRAWMAQILPLLERRASGDDDAGPAPDLSGRDRSRSAATPPAAWSGRPGVTVAGPRPERAPAWEPVAAEPDELLDTRAAAEIGAQVARAVRRVAELVEVVAAGVEQLGGHVDGHARRLASVEAELARRGGAARLAPDQGARW